MPVSIFNQNRRNVFVRVRLNPSVLLSLDFSLNFHKSVLIVPKVTRCLFRGTQKS